MRGKEKGTRVKSEIIHLDYISPWKSPQESGRNDLEILMNKGKMLEEIATPKQIWVKGEPFNEAVLRSQASSPKKTARTCVKTIADCQKEMQRSYNSNFYSKSQPLRKSAYSKQMKSLDNAIFAKKFPPSHKPKLVTVGTETSDYQEEVFHQANLFPKSRRRQGNHNQSQLSSNKQRYMLKKQAFTCHFLKNQITSSKDFVASLSNCLNSIEGTSNQQNSQKLTKTLKNFLTHYKKF